MSPHPLNGGIRSAWFYKNCDASNSPALGLIHQVNLHIVRLKSHLLITKIPPSLTVFTLHQATCIGTRCDEAKLEFVRQWTK
jgi:hypothetical protein